YLNEGGFRRLTVGDRSENIGVSGFQVGRIVILVTFATGFRTNVDRRRVADAIASVHAIGAGRAGRAHRTGRTGWPRWPLLTYWTNRLRCTGASAQQHQGQQDAYNIQQFFHLPSPGLGLIGMIELE